MKFLQDYLLYNQSNEVPRNFHIWSALALLSAVVSRKIHISQGYFTHHPNIYVCLVGEQGDRKSTAKDIARDILVELFPDLPVAASVTTREAITKYLASDESIRTYKDENGAIIEYHPYVLFINELKNFLSVNPAGMIDFLTDIYDRKYFKVETKNKGTDTILNPCLTILACETPGWIVRKLKEDVISGGFSRRMIMVYETNNDAAIPRPSIKPESLEALKRIKEHLLMVSNIVGEFKWSDAGAKAFDSWYIENRKNLPDDTTMRGYRRTKDAQLLKICMLLAMTFPSPSLILTEELIELGKAHLDAIEKNMPRLSIAAGRNELAVPQQKLLELVAAKGGKIAEKELLWLTSKDFSPAEQFSVIRFLRDAEQLFRVEEVIPGTTNKRVFLVTREYIRKSTSGAS